MDIINFSSFNNRSNISLTYVNDHFILQTAEVIKINLLPYKFIHKLLNFRFPVNLLVFILNMDRFLQIKKPIPIAEDKNLCMRIHKQDIESLFMLLVLLQEHGFRLPLDHISVLLYNVLYNEKEKKEFGKQFDEGSYWSQLFMNLYQQLEEKFLYLMCDTLIKIIEQNKNITLDELKSKIFEHMDVLDNGIYEYVDTFDFKEQYDKNIDQILSYFIKHHTIVLNTEGITIGNKDLNILNSTNKLTTISLSNLIIRSLLKEYYNNVKEKIITLTLDEYINFARGRTNEKIKYSKAH